MKSSAIGEPCIDEWSGVIESTPRACRQTLREPTHFILAGEPDVTTDQTCTLVDPDRIRCVHQNIGNARISEQWLQSTCAEEFASQYLDEFEYRTIAKEHSLLAKCRCDVRRCRLALPCDESSTNALK